jgi:hypothetical protein
MTRYKGRVTPKKIARLYPHVVEVMVPPGGLGRRIYDMHAFHRQRGIRDQHLPRRRDDEHDYSRWCFADRVHALALTLEFSGTSLPVQVRERAAVRPRTPMSALDQKQTFAPQKAMSALPPKADMCGATTDAR